MITKITDLNKAAWEAVFTEASKESGVTVHDLPSFFSVLETLKAQGKFQFLRVPVDEPTFVIDGDTRTIQVPKVFKDNGISVQGDHTAEVLFFEIDRYFDDQDLSLFQSEDPTQGACLIQWRNNTTNDTMLAPAYAFNVSEDKIVFGWIISEYVTEAQGSIDFAVRFVKVDPITNKIEYSFSTLTATCQIKPALDMDLFNTAKEDVNDAVLKRKTYSGIVNTTAAAFPHIIQDIAATGELASDTGLLELVLKANSSDGGIITYEWRKVGSEDKLEGETTNVSGVYTSRYYADAHGTYYAYIGNEIADKGTRYVQSNSITIPGADPITIKEEIAARGYASGDEYTVHLKVEVEGENGALTYNWQKDGATLEDADPTSKEYTPAANADGKYTVTVRNTRNKDYKEVTSQVCDVRRRAIKPTGVSVEYDKNSGVLSCVVTAPSRDLQYQWLTVDAGKVGLETATQRTLTLTKKQQESGQYYCRVKQVVFADSDKELVDGGMRDTSAWTPSENKIVMPTGNSEIRE